MNRIIKFRGKCIISNEWVYGDLIHGVSSKEDKIYILPNRKNVAGVQVHPHTVGQFTGLTDINGNEIYEGDVLEHENKEKCKVVWSEGLSRFAAYPITGESTTNIGVLIWDECTIKGNIHDETNG